MGNLTIVNAEWEILDDLKDALEEALELGTRIFESVEILVAEPEIADTRYVKATSASIIYNSTEENQYTDGGLACTMNAVIRVVGRGNTAESRIQTVLKLVNAAKLAINDDPPDNARAIGETDTTDFHELFSWGEVTIQDGDSRQPWAVADLPITIAFERTA